MLCQLSRQLCFFYISIKLIVAKSHIFLGAVTAYTLRNGMFNIVFWTSSNKVLDTNVITSIKTYLPLFTPQLEFQDICICRLYVVTRCFLVKFAYLVSIFLVFFILLALQIINSSTHIGIIQFSRILNMHFCIRTARAFTDFPEIIFFFN